MNNKDLINRQLLIEEIKKNPEKDINEIINELPAEDPENYSEWVPNIGSGWICGHCHAYSSTMSKYCSACGYILGQPSTKRKFSRKNKREEK